MRFIDAMQMNVSKIQTALAEQPAAAPFLIQEAIECQRWVGMYRQTRVEVLGENA